MPIPIGLWILQVETLEVEDGVVELIPSWANTARARHHNLRALCSKRCRPVDCHSTAESANPVTSAGPFHRAPPPCRRRTRRASSRLDLNGGGGATAPSDADARHGRLPRAEVRLLGPRRMRT